MDEASIGETVKSLRLARGLTQADLAAQVGGTQASIARIETGKVEASRMLAEVAVALGRNIEDLDPSFPRLVGPEASPISTITREETAETRSDPLSEDVAYVVAALERHASKLKQKLGFDLTIKQALQNLFLEAEKTRSRT